jgi:hypothetical protein
MSFLFGGKQKTPDELMKVRHAPYHACRPLPLHPDNKLDMHNLNPKHSETGVQAQRRPLRSRNRERACQSSETGALCVHMYTQSYTRAAYNSSTCRQPCTYMHVTPYSSSPPPAMEYFRAFCVHIFLSYLMHIFFCLTVCTYFCVFARVCI